MPINFRLLFFVLVFGVGSYFAYSYFNSIPQGPSKPFIQKRNNEEVIIDPINNYSFSIITDKKFSISAKILPSGQRSSLVLRKSNFLFEEQENNTYSVGFSPEQFTDRIGEAAIFYGAKSFVGKFSPSEYWKDFINEPFFRYFEYNINGFKAYSTATYPGIGVWVNTIVIINDNNYIEFSYVPSGLVDMTEFDNSNYGLKNSKFIETQLYFDILNSLKKLN